MTDMTPSVSELREALADLEIRLYRFGYSSIYLKEIAITDDAILGKMGMSDDFQDKISWDERIQSGIISFSWNETTRRFHIPTGFLTLEQRELSIAASRLGKTKEIMQRMSSAFATAYVEQLTADQARFQKLTYTQEPF